MRSELCTAPPKQRPTRHARDLLDIIELLHTALNNNFGSHRGEVKKEERTRTNKQNLKSPKQAKLEITETGNKETNTAIMIKKQSAVGRTFLSQLRAHPHVSSHEGTETERHHQPQVWGNINEKILQCFWRYYCFSRWSQKQ